MFVVLIFIVQLSSGAESWIGVDYDGDRADCGPLWIFDAGDLLYCLAGG